MLRTTDIAHRVLCPALKPGDWAVDATVGNGHDTVFLARLVGPQGRVFGFDVQQQALDATARRVAGCPQVRLVHAGHETLAARLPDDARGRVAAVMFNLGYLPGGAHDVTTRAETTLAGLEQSLAFVATGGLVTLVLYPGHPGGAEEAGAVRSYAGRLPGAFSVTLCARLGATPAVPELLVIERRR